MHISFLRSRSTCLTRGATLAAAAAHLQHVLRLSGTRWQSDSSNDSTQMRRTNGLKSGQHHKPHSGVRPVRA